MKHALDADHVAAVASLATRSTSLRSTVKVATAWGVGHAVTLVLVGSTLIGLETTLSDPAARVLELLVGVMLVTLGVDVLRRLRQGRVHLHLHAHPGGVRHAHFHSHLGEPSHVHGAAAHAHRHGPWLVPRAGVVGALHGMAGTAALVVVALPGLRSSARAFAYLLFFAGGSIIGMMLFSLVISIPLHLSARRLNRFSAAAQASLALINIALGAWIVAKASGV